MNESKALAPTPGQVAYEAFAAHRIASTPNPTGEWNWGLLAESPGNFQASWEVAAQAVRLPFERRELLIMQVLDSTDYASRMNQLDAVREILFSEPDRRTQIEEESLELCERVATLRTALERLANEADGFLSQADPSQHGHTNMAVLRQRIDESRQALAGTSDWRGPEICQLPAQPAANGETT